MVLSAAALTVAPQGSFNNELGLPAPSSRSPRPPATWSPKWAPVEPDTSPIVCTIAPPDGHGPQRRAGPPQRVRKSRQHRQGEVGDRRRSGLRRGCRAQRRRSRVMGMAAKAPGRIITFGRSAGADVRITALDLDDGRPVVTLAHGGEEW